jgi:ADP-ribose pyrophosphatase YjhB (NUDIX family)
MNCIFYLGRRMEDSAKGFSDFGGRVEEGETITETAMREGAEELSGFLGNSDQLSERIKKSGGVYKITHGSGNKEYHVHIFYMEYDSKLPYYFTNHHKFVWNKMDKQMLNDSKLFEKQEIRWFNVREMKSNIGEFREFYREIVSLFLKNISNIKKFIKSKEKKRTKSMGLSSKRRTMRKMKGG